MPSGPAFNGPQTMPGAYPVYENGNAPPNPQYSQVRYLPQTQPYPQQQYVNAHPQYPVMGTQPIPPYDGAIDQHPPPRPQYVQPQQVQQMAPPMPSYPPAPVAQQQMPPPLQRPQQAMTPTRSPKPSQNRRISSDGAVQKPVKGQRKSTSGAVAKSPTMSSSGLVDVPSLLMCIADECFSKAYAGVQRWAVSMEAGNVQEYHRLMATGLSCIEAALQTNKLAPRAEAVTRLRYAAIISEETENLMEAETSLGKAITLCEKHRFPDLKLYTQFLLMRVLFRRNRKAALIALDQHISDSITYKNVYWTYAFRFLKASFHLQSSSPADAHALENLRSIATLANERGDNAVCVMSALLEGLTHLRTMRDDTFVRVQTCIAQASKYQLDSSVHIPQLDILTLVLDLACSLHEKVPETAKKKLTALQDRLETLRDSGLWNDDSPKLLLPLRKQTASHTISNDTSALLRPGNDQHDYLVMTAFSRVEAYVLAYSFSGIATLYKHTTADRCFDYWNEALNMLASCAKVVSSSPLPLHEAMSQADWRLEVSSYMCILIGLQSATRSDWAKVRDCIQKLEQLVKRPLESSLDVLTLYLKGSYEQGVGNLDTALAIYEDARFAIHGDESPQNAGRKAKSQVPLLAALNRLLIISGERFRNEQKTSELVEQLRQLCADHPDPDITTAYNLVMASIHMHPPLSINRIKRHIQAGLQGAQATDNTHCLSIALNIMRCRLFENVVGEQAVKSARAGSAQAKRSGNLLWMSVADGMLSHSYEVQGAAAEARATFEAGTRYANESWDRTQ